MVLLSLYLYFHRDQLIHFPWVITVSLVPIWILLAIASQVFAFLPWYYLAHSFNSELRWKEGLRAYFLSTPSKLIPGKIGNLMHRTALTVGEGFTFHHSASLLILDQAWLMASAGFWAALSMMYLNSWNWSIILLFAPFLLSPPLWFQFEGYIFKGLKKLTSKGLFKKVNSSLNINSALSPAVTPISTMYSWNSMFILLVLHGINWIFYGLAIWLFAIAFGGVTLPTIATIASQLQAWLAGNLAWFTASGLGVSEPVFAVTLNGIFPESILITIALAFRICYLIIEIGICVMVWKLFPVKRGGVLSIGSATQRTSTSNI